MPPPLVPLVLHSQSLTASHLDSVSRLDFSLKRQMVPMEASYSGN